MGEGRVEWLLVDGTRALGSLVEDAHVRPYFDLSPAHLSREALAWVEREAVARGMVSAVVIGDAADDGDGFPLSLACIFGMARSRGCDWIVFDPTTDLHGDLAVYERLDGRRHGEAEGPVWAAGAGAGGG